MKRFLLTLPAAGFIHLTVETGGQPYEVVSVLLPVARIDSMTASYEYSSMADSSGHVVHLFAPLSSETHDSYYQVKNMEKRFCF